MRAVSSGAHVRSPGEYVRPGSVLILADECPSIATQRWFFAVGSTYHQKALSRFHDGRPVQVEFVPEPGNPHDNLAVALDVDGQRCAYVHADSAAWYHDVVRGLNAGGSAVVTSGVVRATTWTDDNDRPRSGWALDYVRPHLDDLRDLAVAAGLRDAHDRVVATLTADQRVEMLDDCWDEYSKGVVKALSRDANLAPELTWSTDTDLPRSERVPIWHYSFARDDLLIHRERLRHQSQVRALAQRRQEALEKGARDAARQQVTEAKHAQRRAQHAEALALHAGGLSHQKVADRVGVTRSTVEAWVRQVRLAADPEGGKDYHDRMARERVDRALRATRPQEESLSRKEIRVDLNCGQEAVKALLRDGRFYRDPQADQHRLDIALRARNLLADGVVKDKIAAALNLTTPATIRACRDAFALEHLNYPAGQPTPRSAGQAPLPA